MTAPSLENLKYYLIKPKASINYVTNPTPYRTIMGYMAVTGSIAASTISGRRGPLCIEVTPTTAESGIYFGTVSVTNGKDYVFSCDVKGEAGKAMRLRVEDAGGTYTHETTFTATGYWQRPEVTFTAEETASDYRLYVLRDATTGTTAFHVDGFQFEEGDTATTFFTGDTKGFGRAPLEFYWGGTPHASISYRTADTRAGGELIDIKALSGVSNIIGSIGLGMGRYEQLYTELASGGAYYQKHVRRPRNFSLIIQYYGNNLGDLHDARNSVLEACLPDLTGYDQPMIVRYQGFDSSGDEATNPIDIVCVPQFSHADLPNAPFNNRDILSFTVLDSYLSGAYAEGKGLKESQVSAVEDIVMRDSDGNWNNMDGGVTDVVRTIVEAPNGDVYIGGSFTNAGTIIEADFLAKWDGLAWDDVTGAADFNGTIYALCFDADGNLYIGGGYTDAGDVNGDCIVKWDGTNLSSLGTGVSSGIRALAIDPSTGYLYAGGMFALAGGVANTAHVAYWDGTTWHPMATGLNNTVWGLEFGPDGNLYIGGSFTNADGANGDYLCYWDGTSFNRIGTTELNGSVYDLAFDNGGNLLVGGAFTNAGENTNADYIAKWNGSQWEGLGTGLGASVYSIFIDLDNNIYVCGEFTTAGGLSLSDRVAYYANGSWHMLDIDLPGTGLIEFIFIDSHNNLYIGGDFSTAADGGAISSEVATCINSGNAKVFPTIEIQGPGVLQSITNYSTGKEIQFDGLTLQAGEIIVIQPVSGQVLITSNWGGRGYMQKYINPGSDIGSFYLKPGTNYISLFMPSGTTAATRAFIYWTPKFWNIEGSRYE